VVVAHENRVAMAETLEDGLGLLFGGTLPTRGNLAAADSTARATTGAATTAGASTVPADVLRQAQEHFDRAIAAQRAGDWAAYGREIDQLGAVLKQLRAGGRKP
jgi:uncharacterized membrane protein (UPF0182 family)